MALTIRSNGIAGGLINASWWNDYANLLTGVMSDQQVTIHNNLAIKAIVGASGSPTSLALTTGTALGIGVYNYGWAFLMGDGEGIPANTSSITTTSGNQKVIVGAPLGPTGTTARKLWRTKVGQSGPFWLITTINDNTTTTYTDAITDASLTTNPPAISTFGGGLSIEDSGGGKNFIVDPGGNVLFKGTLGTVVVGDVLDASIAGTVYIKTNSSAGTLELQFPNGTTSMRFISNAIVVPQWLGIKRTNGTKLAEFLGNGNLVISGTQYQTTAGSISTVTGGTFDSFDVGEVFECADTYPNGTVVCPGPDNKLHLCTHDNCPCAMIISYNPGLGLGANDHENQIHYVAMAGRVNVRTAQDIQMRTMVVSDGRGGVRALKPNEPSFVLGFTLNETSVIDHSPMVGLFLRPQFITLRSPH